MITRTAIFFAAALIGATASAAGANPFAAPVKDCHPCRFSPGPGQPQFDLTFVFTGTGDSKALSALDIAPAGGGPHQRLDTGDIAVSGFADGFTLDTSDMNGDGLGDLSITTGEYAAGNSSAVYWVYEPATHRFVPLERSGGADADNDNRAFSSIEKGVLLCHVHDSALAYENYWYRIAGHRAIAFRKEAQDQDNALVVRTITDLSVTPPRVLKRVTVGYFGDSPARTAFLERLDAAGREAATLYKKHNAKGAAAVMQGAVGTIELALAVDSYPVQGDDPADRKLVGEFNDYGFYLAEAGRPKEALDILGQVVDVDADRVPAYLNLADAQYAAGDNAGAKANYAEYQKRMAATGKAAKVPPRVAERLR